MWELVLALQNIFYTKFCQRSEAAYQNGCICSQFSAMLDWTQQLGILYVRKQKIS